MAESYDTLIVGAGHNGLVCAAYLGMAGLKVKVVERRNVVGGAAVTEEFHPGFRNSVAAYTVSLLNPKVIRDLDLPAHGLKIVERRALNFLPTEDGRAGGTWAGGTWAGAAGPTVAERKDELRAANASVAARLVDLTGWSHARVNGEMNRLAGVTRVATATTEQLERRLRYAESWLRRLRRT